MRQRHGVFMYPSDEKPHVVENGENVILFSTTLVALLLSGLNPNDRFTWMLEVSWVAAGLVIVFATRRSFPLTQLLRRLLFLHAIFLITGGHYTYEKVPAGLWLKEQFDLSRNHYDRLGHFLQGFVPAILAREILTRKSPAKNGAWLFLFVLSINLAFSSFFEMIEWWVSVSTGEAGNAFLATQGDIWDTQWDMFLCMLGSICAQILLSKIHDRQLAKIPGRPD